MNPAELADSVEKMLNARFDDFVREIMRFEPSFGSRYRFEELDIDDRRSKFWDCLFGYLSQDMRKPVHHLCLTALRILSRDTTDLDKLITESRLNELLNKAGLGDSSNETDVEALKVLSNMLYNSTKAWQLITSTKCLPNLIQRIEQYGSETPTEVQLFDFRVLFLTTALSASARHTVKTELNGVAILTNLLENVSSSQPKEEESELVCPILKVLFNLYIQSEDSTSPEEQQKNQKLFMILNNILLRHLQDDERYSNTINLLMVIPGVSFASLKREYPEISGSAPENVFKGVDVRIASNLLTFLKWRLERKEDLIANLTPVLTVLIKLVKDDKVYRKYVRLQILPPLKDVMHRPEEGNTLRAKLCKLLTSPITALRDLVAEFLFLICNESVSRMVKYTGYGNAAGMFANKGLLGPPRAKPVESSDSEDSDTEEYLKYKELINPVTGCYEKPKPHPLEGMSEEQKEYEALQLVDLVDKLTRGGVVQPCRIGEDGKPKPIEHVLQLHEELPKQLYNSKDCSYDSD